MALGYVISYRSEDPTDPTNPGPDAYAFWDGTKLFFATATDPGVDEAAFFIDPVDARRVAAIVQSDFPERNIDIIQVTRTTTLPTGINIVVKS
jgi:hypothetical protein